MKAKAHVTAVTAAFLTLRQRLAQRLEKNWSRKPLAALLAGFLMAVLAPTAALAQHAVGSLYFLNRSDGSEAYGYIDKYGFFRQTFNGGITAVAAPWIGATHVVNSTNGLLIYNAGNGTASVEQIKDNGLPSRGGSYNFSLGWTNIVSIGDHLFFYNSDGSAAIGYITPDRKFVGMASYPQGSFLHWTHVIATNNNLFFYNSTDGSALVGYIYPSSGAFVQTQSLPPGSLPTDFSYIVSDGNFLLLYNQQTGASMVGVIDSRPGQFQSRWSGSLPPGYNKLVRHDHYLLLYNSNSGGGTIGYIDRISAAKFIVTQQPAFSAGWTRIVSTNDDLLFYNSITGSAAVGRIDRNGQFQQTPQVLSFSTGWFGVVATTR